jgi:hypothetical protein
MNYWLWSALALLLALPPCLYVCAAKPVSDKLVALEFGSCIVAWFAFGIAAYGGMLLLLR